MRTIGVPGAEDGRLPTQVSEKFLLLWICLGN